MIRMLKFALIPLFVVVALAAGRASGSGTPLQTPTFNQEVVRLFQKHCQTCHHPGDIAPFSLMTYKESRPWARAIREQVITRQMPPWQPVPGCGEFLDARQLTQAEINTIVAWVDGGSPEGNAADLPAPLTFTDGWPLGTPDVVLTPDAEYEPPKTGDTYRCFSIPTALRGDRFISAVGVNPGNRRIVHHIIAYPDPTGVSEQLDAREPGPGYTCFGGPGFNNTGLIGGWAPGQRGYQAGEGNGIKLSKNSRVVIQVHYHPTGETERDRTSVGLYLANAPVKKELQVQALANRTFTIPAGEKRYQITANSTSPANAGTHLVAVSPHMHLLGREIKLELTPPGGATQCLININDWDFQWQGTYNYQRPIAMPGGARIQMTGVYDNSTDNPLNPNMPPKPVQWGEETTDEMFLAYLSFTLDAETRVLSAPQLHSVQLDANGELQVNGAGFQPGADIEINGRRLSDTREGSASTAATKLLSSDMWRVFAAPGQTVNIAVINPDGVRTTTQSFTRTGTAQVLAAVSAASYSTDALAPEGIATLFSSRLATTTAAAVRTPLPTTLGGTTVRVNGLLAPLFYVSPLQINFQLPPALQSGEAVIEVLAGDNTLSRHTVMLGATAPGIFTANQQGTGAPAALATKDGVTMFGVGNPDGTPNALDAGDFLILFGSGWRRAPSALVKLTIGGVEAPILYAGAQSEYVGLDQLNTQLPTGLTGIVDVVLTVNGKTANVVKVRIK
jgi:uncharacterized protein (TIGR03437 family)